MNGVVSDVKFAEVTTLEPQAGPDPQMSMQCVFDAEAKTWTVTFTATKDCDEYKRYVGDDATLYINRLGTDQMMPFEFYNHWDGWIYAHGILTAEEEKVEVVSADVDNVALCVPLGLMDGKEKVGKMSYAILTKEGEQKLISTYYPGYNEK